MAGSDPRTSERDQTDESLRAERAKTDQAIADMLDLDEMADAVICRARQRADGLLRAARARIDRHDLVEGSGPSAAVERERSRDDRKLAEERSSEDEALRGERAHQVALLTREREETNRDLVSERARADGALKARDEFLGIVSHDLRSLVHLVMGWAQQIEAHEQEASRREDTFEHARRIQRAGGRMNRLVGDLVDVASIEAGVLTVSPEPGDPTQLVTEAVDAFQARAASHGLTLHALPMAPFSASFDPARVLQVLANLLGNALKFTARGGSVVAHVEQAGEEVRFTVKDTGEGIPSDKLKIIFDRFIQVGKNDRRGVGLGLFISKSIVQGHGGRIWAESTLGSGSTFRFTIPRQRTQSTRTSIQTMA